MPGPSTAACCVGAHLPLAEDGLMTPSLSQRAKSLADASPAAEPVAQPCIAALEVEAHAGTRWMFENQVVSQLDFLRVGVLRSARPAEISAGTAGHQVGEALLAVKTGYERPAR